MGKYALIMVGALIFSLLTYSYALKNALFQTNVRSVQSYSQNQAHNIAQSAAMLAINELRSGDKETSIFFPNDEVVGEVKSYPSATTFEDWKDDVHGSYHLDFTLQSDELLIVESTGKFEDVTHKATVALSFGLVPWNPKIDQAVHAEHKIEMTGSDQIIGDASINSNNSGSVDLGSGNDKITGNLFLGSGGEADQVLAGNDLGIGGEIKTVPGKQDFRMPPFPEFPEIELNAGSVNGGTTLDPEDYHNKYFNEINLKGNSKLVINTGSEGDSLTVHVGALDIQSSDIELEGDGHLKIYVDTKLNMKGNATVNVNNNGDVSQLELFYKGYQEVDLYDETLAFGGTTQLNGSLFADKANINLNGTAGIQGNIITGGGSVVVNGNPNLVSENARVIFAPNALVELKGNVSLEGAVISDQFKSNGNGTVEYISDLDAELPDLLEQANFDIVYWN